VEDDVPKTDFNRTRFESRDGAATVSIDRNPGEDKTPAQKAGEVRRALLGQSGYEELDFGPTSIAGEPAYELDFNDPEGRKLAIYRNIDGTNYSVLGEGSDSENALAAARRVARSIEPTG